jgi:pimeloyl-ACP methyl ester carboxylesterase
VPDQHDGNARELAADLLERPPRVLDGVQARLVPATDPVAELEHGQFTGHAGEVACERDHPEIRQRKRRHGLVPVLTSTVQDKDGHARSGRAELTEVGFGHVDHTNFRHTSLSAPVSDRFGILPGVIEHIGINTAQGRFDGLAAGQEDGRPVLLLHGFPEASTEWEHQLATLSAAGYRAIAPDQRGYSPEVRPERPEDYSIEDLTQDVLDMADELAWPRFDLVGHDWGGNVAWHVAAGHPDRIRTLTVVSTPHPGAYVHAMKTDEDQQQRSSYVPALQNVRGAEKQLLANNAAALKQMYEGVVPRDHVREYVERLSEPGALVAALNWYRGIRFSGRTGKVKVPTMYVWGTEDVAFGSTAALATGEWVEGPYRFEMFEDITHWLPEQADEGLSRLLLEHMSQHG